VVGDAAVSVAWLAGLLALAGLGGAFWLLRREAPPAEPLPVAACPDCGGAFAWGNKFRLWAPVCRSCEGVWLHAALPAVERRGSGISHFVAFPETPAKPCPACGTTTLEAGHIGIAHALGCTHCGSTFRPGPGRQVPKVVAGA